MRIQDFLNLVYDGLPGQLSAELRKHDWRVRWSLLQVYFEKPAVHYEVWVQRKARRIELGLHFECEREESYRWAEVLAPRAIEIQAQLGQNVELEEWTKSWTRLHETLHLDADLSEALAADVAQRLARYIEVLEPILQEERATIAG
ncbi:MAG: hypothetical protein IIC91_08450 [Chloroflexi bacterium]|nr:hypothetical protein [Chloroflexota bacterium]MCH8008882.1 hypothetical protein [Chloroflexota bacterium]